MTILTQLNYTFNLVTLGFFFYKKLYSQLLSLYNHVYFRLPPFKSLFLSSSHFTFTKDIITHVERLRKCPDFGRLSFTYNHIFRKSGFVAYIKQTLPAWLSSPCLSCQSYFYAVLFVLWKHLCSWCSDITQKQSPSSACPPQHSDSSILSCESASVKESLPL